MRQWTHDLVYFTPPDTLTDTQRSELVARAIGIVEGAVEQLVITDDQLRGVRLADGRTVPREALFVPPVFVPNSRLLVDLGCDADDAGWVATDPSGRTSVAGVWAAGNVVDPAPRSSPPPAPAPRPRSPSTPTSSTKTSASPSTPSRPDLARANLPKELQ